MGVVKWCVERAGGGGGVDVNATNKFGNTALHLTLERARACGGASEPRRAACAQIGKYLRARGARDDLRNQMGVTCRQRIRCSAVGPDDDGPGGAAAREPPASVEGLSRSSD